ncbi:hypothetical protein ACO0K0_18105 [Undibacterium sp. SXout11W]|uniref:hypothetical protein n=1 Tax=Undibacterium sp. SXout11W TaxID=3413050 RepID=UPI003BEFC34F
MASRLGGASKQAPLPLTLVLSERTRARYSDAESAQPTSRKTFFPQTAQGLALPITSAYQ